MILLLDIGNTRIKWGSLIGGEFAVGGALLRAKGDVAELIEAVEAKQYRPTRVVVSNVAQASYRELLADEVGTHWGCEVVFPGVEVAAFGVINGYDEPQRLGVDRWLALIAARQLVDGALCVIDCGTALTVDLLTQEGEHLGGMITPGVGLMQAALLNNTEGLHVAGAWPAEEESLLMACNTADAISGGAYYALIALIERVANDLRAPLGDDVSLILTGGDAAIISAHLRCRVQLEPDLVLRGVAMVAEASS